MYFSSIPTEGLTTRSSEQRLAVGSVSSIISFFASLCR